MPQQKTFSVNISLRNLWDARRLRPSYGFSLCELYLLVSNWDRGACWFRVRRASVDNGPIALA
jgi:hypothetical protein